jgi:CheY-like chemotaxis protein
VRTPPRILVVDDNASNIKIMQVRLASEGYDVVTAADGEEALAAAREQLPDLILLDVMMPGMDGYQVVARIKANPDTAHIPVVMLTALDDRNSRTHGLTAGAAAFLTKPIDRHALREAVMGLLRAPTSPRAHDA